MNEFGAFCWCWFTVFEILMEYISYTKDCSSTSLLQSSNLVNGFILWYLFANDFSLPLSFAFYSIRSRCLSVCFLLFSLRLQKQHTHTQPFQRVFTSHVVWEYFFTLQWFIYNVNCTSIINNAFTDWEKVKDRNIRQNEWDMRGQDDEKKAKQKLEHK